MIVRQLKNEFTDAFVDKVARVSFNADDRGRQEDEIKRMNSFLVREVHWSPMGHPIITLETYTANLPLQQLLSDKFLSAGLNFKFKGEITIITGSAWGFLQLARYLGSKELFEIMGTKLPIVTTAYLAKHRPELHTYEKRLWHTAETPVEHQFATFRVTTTLPIRSQLFKHEMGFVKNEISRRYVKSEPALDKIRQWRGKPANAKQGSSGEIELPKELLADIELLEQDSLNTYTALIEAGAAPEQARFYLLQAMETGFIITGYRYAYENMFSLRCKPDAQLEIQNLVEEIRSTIVYQGA